MNFWEYSKRLVEGAALLTVQLEKDLPVTALHMNYCESYPSTFDSIHGNYMGMTI